MQPGAEADALLEDLRAEFLALEDPATGERIVKHVLTADEAFGPDHSVDLPDLMVAFRDDLGPIEECRSERLGHLRVPLGRDPNLPRTGDHTVQSRLWAVGPAFAGAPSGTTRTSSTSRPPFSLSSTCRFRTISTGGR